MSLSCPLLHLEIMTKLAEQAFKSLAFYKIYFTQWRSGNFLKLMNALFQGCKSKKPSWFLQQIFFLANGSYSQALSWLLQTPPSQIRRQQFGEGRSFSVGDCPSSTSAIQSLKKDHDLR